MAFASPLRRGFAAGVAVVSMFAGAAHAEFTPQVGWNQQLYPSFVIATATVKPSENAAEDESKLGDASGLIGISIVAPSDDCAITVTVSGDPAFEESIFTGVLPTEGETYYIRPRVKYDFAALAANKQSTPLTVTFSVQIGDEEAVEEETVTATLRSVNDCPFTIGSGEQAVDVSFTFAAYVNEQHPFVEKVLREALDGEIVDSFIGYQSGEASEVYRQVYALWDALTNRDIRYADITVEAANNAIVASQHVRLIDESINNSQANCVDGSVLLASLLRKVGIEPVLVFLPTHCYLGFYTDRDATQLVFIETTMLGSERPDELPEVADLQDIVEEAQAESASWGTFVSAIAAGTANFASNSEKFAAANDPGYQLVPIAPARKQGILPIAFEAGEEFVAAQDLSVNSADDDDQGDEKEEE